VDDVAGQARRVLQAASEAQPLLGSAIVAGMRVAALYDIHGNVPALRAVLSDARHEDVGAFVIGGDVALGPLPHETIEQLMALGGRARFVRGNADREIVDAYDQGHTDIDQFEDPAERAAVFAASRISRQQRDFMADFAPTVALDVDGLGPTVFCHGSPRSDTEIITRVTRENRLREILGDVQEHVVVGGHVHQQFDRSIDRWRFVNAGSVGIPYEGQAGAYWALVGPDVQLRRTEYDLQRAIEELRLGGYPDLDEMLKESLLEPVDPQEVAEFFERQALEGR
jgi:predicted phosphodiesterase